METTMGDTPPRKVLWSGIQIDATERAKLNRAMAQRLQPLLQEGWQQANKPPPGVPPEELPDHMTIVAMKELPPEMKSLLGTVQQMRIVAWGQNDQAAAVQVESVVKSMNATPHITMAVSPIGKPFHSNNIVDWEPLPPNEQITISGTVVEKTPSI